MKRLVIALAALMALSPLAALADTQNDKPQTQIQAQAQDHSVPDYYTLEVGGSGN